ncbi:hypothetical protein ACFVYE_45350 [Streptomyces sp. NPDC058239]
MSVWAVASSAAEMSRTTSPGSAEPFTRVANTPQAGQALAVSSAVTR